MAACATGQTPHRKESPAGQRFRGSQPPRRPRTPHQPPLRRRNAPSPHPAAHRRPHGHPILLLPEERSSQKTPPLPPRHQKLLRSFAQSKEWDVWAGTQSCPRVRLCKGHTGCRGGGGLPQGPGAIRGSPWVRLSRVSPVRGNK